MEVGPALGLGWGWRALLIGTHQHLRPIASMWSSFSSHPEELYLDWNTCSLDALPNLSPRGDLGPFHVPWKLQNQKIFYYHIPSLRHWASNDSAAPSKVWRKEERAKGTRKLWLRSLFIISIILSSRWYIYLHVNNIKFYKFIFRWLDHL